VDIVMHQSPQAPNSKKINEIIRNNELPEPPNGIYDNQLEG